MLLHWQNQMKKKKEIKDKKFYRVLKNKWLTLNNKKQEKRDAIPMIYHLTQFLIMKMGSNTKLIAMKMARSMKDLKNKMWGRASEFYISRLALFNIKEIGLTTYSMAKVASLMKKLVITFKLGMEKIVTNWKVTG
jgi:hypothetical protein